MMQQLPPLTGQRLSMEFYLSSLSLLEILIPDIMARAAVGLVGEGSECFGCDDAISRDHDWGPAFCLWLDKDTCRCHSQRITEALCQLPKTFQSFPTRMQPESWGNRVGLIAVEDFYGRFLGRQTVPTHWKEWRAIPEKFLAVCTNGQVYIDPEGSFSAIRQDLLDYYPEDWRRNKIAARCMAMSQTGQYNLLRAKQRTDALGAMLIRARFAEAALSMVYLLNRRYMPFYKWAGILVRPLPILGAACSSTLEALAAAVPNEDEYIEQFCAMVAACLRTQGLSTAETSWLWEHGPQVQSGIQDQQLRDMPPQWE